MHEQQKDNRECNPKIKPRKVQTTGIKQKVTQKKGRLLSTYNHYIVENNKQYCDYYIKILMASIHGRQLSVSPLSVFI